MIILYIVLGIVSCSAIVGITALIIDIIKGQNYSYSGIYEKYLKRLFDVFLSTGAIIILSPLLLITAILVRIKLGSPVIFKQDRPGKDEKIFKLYKFRTMTDQKDANGQLLPDEVRLTKFGKKLRATSLDELPELINIIRGDMSIVGPRPLLPHLLPWYSDMQRHRHDVRPGLTGYAQIHGRNMIDWDERLDMDVKYASNITFVGDLRILLGTIATVFKREGISSNTSVTMGGFADYCISKGRKPRE